MPGAVEDLLVQQELQLVGLILPIIYGGLGWILAIFSRAVSTGISRSSDAIPSYLTLSYPILGKISGILED